MRSKKRRKRPETPELCFRRKLMEEYRKTPGMTVKAERMAQGGMWRYRVEYVHASHLDPRQLEMQLRALWGDGSCLLRFVDETRQPLDEFGGVWIDLGDYDDLDDRLEEAQFAANMATLKMVAEMKKKSSDTEMAVLAKLVSLTGNIRRSRPDPALLDAFKRSMNTPRSDGGEVTLETARMIGEMRNQEYQLIMKQRADAAEQLQTALAAAITEMQTLQAQELECETQTELVGQGRRFPLEDCSPPIVGLSRMKTKGILQGLDKFQDRGEDDQ